MYQLRRRRLRVHPRLRGGAPSAVRGIERGGGPSPPTRGSLIVIAFIGRPARSIPAYAGEPQLGRTGRSSPEVHPRLRGGARGLRRGKSSERGPSPPTRGSPATPTRGIRWTGSIPAYAGEPRGDLVGILGFGVHPRLRGGAVKARRFNRPAEGPSPPTRGSQRRIGLDESVHGSIPAYAGEPSRADGGARSDWVHPRLRGGAANDAEIARLERGPSPPTRESRM